MKVNLKKLTVLQERLQYSERIFAERDMTKPLVKPIKELRILLEEVSNDLEMCGESILELDIPRLDAIKERDKFLEFLHKADEP